MAAQHAATLPEVVGKSNRLSSFDLLKFERVLLAADRISSAHFAMKRLRRKRCRCNESRASESAHTIDVPLATETKGDLEQAEHVDGNDDVLRALVKTICVTTNVEDPGEFTNAGDAIRWASTSILESRNKCIVDTRNEKCLHILDSDQTVQAFELVNKLNLILSKQSPTH